jgi:hypothetical protein
MNQRDTPPEYPSQWNAVVAQPVKVGPLTEREQRGFERTVGKTRRFTEEEMSQPFSDV